MRTKVNLSEIEDIKNGTDPATNLRRSGFVVISQLRNEFEKVDFSKKFLDDLKAFKIEFPTANKTKFIEYETTRLTKIKEYLQQCTPDNYSDFPEYQTLSSYLDDKINKVIERKFTIEEKYEKTIFSLYEKSIEYELFDCEKVDFLTMIRYADFEKLNIFNKTKVSYLIYLLSKLMGQDWYKRAAESIGTTKKRCSGATIYKNDPWKIKANKIVDIILKL